MSKKLLATLLILSSMMSPTDLMSEVRETTYQCQRCKKGFYVPTHKCPVCRGKVR